MVALGVLLGARVGSDYGERFGVNREDTYRTGTLMVIAGIVGSRITWDLSHTEDLHDIVDWFAIWKGGIQFSGGFIAALIVGWPMFRQWGKVQRWHVLNGYSLGLTLGVAIGRIGCYSVGEHFGRQTDFFLGTRYDGGDVRESTLGDIPLREGMVFHNTALYEMITMFLLAAFMVFLIWRARRVGHEVLPVTLASLFMIIAGVIRFGLDTLRVNDERILHMTGAQWMSMVMVPYGLWLWFSTRPKIAKLCGPDGRELEPESASLLLHDNAEPDEDEAAVPDELEAPDHGESGSSDGEEPESDDEPEPEPEDDDAEVKADAAD
jgi:phosphatidylglycerol:prolipoprotein diacylglycerol transferase